MGEYPEKYGSWQQCIQILQKGGREYIVLHTAKIMLLVDFSPLNQKRSLRKMKTLYHLIFNCF